MLSMKEIAEKAGVSVATVSRVFNGSALVAEKSRIKVERCLEENHYTMNHLARNLKKKRSYNIIALVPSLNNPIFTEMISGVFNRAKDYDYNVLIGSIEEDYSRGLSYINLLESKQADGILFLAKSFNKQLLDQIIGKFPYVLCNEWYIGNPDCPFVGFDDYKAVQEASEYLFSKGCSKIAYVSGRTTSPSTARRIRAFKDCLEAHGIQLSLDNVIFGSNSSYSSYPKICEFLRSGDYDGFLGNSIFTSSLILKALLTDQKMKVEDIHLVALDGNIMADMTTPEITSIIQPSYQIGFMAVDSLIAQIEKKDFERHIIVPFEFKIRGT